MHPLSERKKWEKEFEKKFIFFLAEIKKGFIFAPAFKTKEVHLKLLEKRVLASEGVQWFDSAVSTRMLPFMEESSLTY